MNPLSPRHLNDRDLFAAAADLARQRSHWRQLAWAGGTQHHTRRQCQLKACERETRIVNLAIVAELRCERDHHARGAA